MTSRRAIQTQLALLKAAIVLTDSASVLNSMASSAESIVLAKIA